MYRKITRHRRSRPIKKTKKSKKVGVVGKRFLTLKSSIPMRKKAKCEIGKLRRNLRFGEVAQTQAPQLVLPVEYGPGYNATSQQSYENMFVPYYGQKVPWTNPSNWWAPVADGKVQLPEMTIH